LPPPSPPPPPRKGGGPCSVAREGFDCLGGGVCTPQGRCECDPQWTGPHCAALDLQPVNLQQPYGARFWDRNIHRGCYWITHLLGLKPVSRVVK
jgi:hypothetical protein